MFGGWSVFGGRGGHQSKRAVERHMHTPSAAVRMCGRQALTSAGTTLEDRHHGQQQLRPATPLRININTKSRCLLLFQRLLDLLLLLLLGVTTTAISACCCCCCCIPSCRRRCCCLAAWGLAPQPLLVLLVAAGALLLLPVCPLLSAPCRLQAPVHKVKAVAHEYVDVLPDGLHSTTQQDTAHHKNHHTHNTQLLLPPHGRQNLLPLCIRPVCATLQTPPLPSNT